jgi:glutathione S-transferase
MQQVEPTTSTSPLRLYYSPKACSLASHIALEESGLPFDAVCVDIRAGDNSRPEYLSINPSGIVPALAVGDTVVTESQAILSFIADVSGRDLLPRPGTLARAKAHEWMNWISSTLHVTYRSIFRPQVYAGEEPAAAAAVRAHAIEKLKKNLAEVDKRLGDGPYALGASFSVVDAYLFVFYLWSFDERIEAALPARPPRYSALALRLWARPKVREAVARERANRAYALPESLSADVD